MSGIRTYKTIYPKKHDDNFHYRKEYVCHIKEKKMDKEDRVYPGDGSKGNWGAGLSQ